MSRAIILAAALAFAACNGDTKDAPADTDTDITATSFTVSVEVSDLDGEGLVLSLNGEEAEITAEGPFTFPTALESGSTYEIEVVEQPTCPAQRCRVSGGFGSVAGADVVGIPVSCDDPRLRAFTHSWGDDSLRITDDVLSLDDESTASPRVIGGPSTSLAGASLDSLAYDAERDLLYVVTPDALLVFADASMVSGDIAPVRSIHLTGGGQIEGIEIDARHDRAYVCGNKGMHLVDAVSTIDGEHMPEGAMRDIACNAVTRDVGDDRLFISGAYNGVVWSIDDAADLLGPVTASRTFSWTPEVTGFEGPAAIYVDSCEDRLYLGSNQPSPAGTSLYALDDASEIDGEIDLEAASSARYDTRQSIVVAGDGTGAVWIGEDSASTLYRYTRADRWADAVDAEPALTLSGLISSGYGLELVAY